MRRNVPLEGGFMDWLNPVTGPIIIVVWVMVVGIVLAVIESKDKKK